MTTISFIERWAAPLTFTTGPLMAVMMATDSALISLGFKDHTPDFLPNGLFIRLILAEKLLS